MASSGDDKPLDWGSLVGDGNAAMNAKANRVSEPSSRYQLAMILPPGTTEAQGVPAVKPEEWAGSSLVKEASLQQIAPFVGKTKCTMARSLIQDIALR